MMIGTSPANVGFTLAISNETMLDVGPSGLNVAEPSTSAAPPVIKPLFGHMPLTYSALHRPDGVPVFEHQRPVVNCQIDMQRPALFVVVHIKDRRCGCVRDMWKGSA